MQLLERVELIGLTREQELNGSSAQVFPPPCPIAPSFAFSERESATVGGLMGKGEGASDRRSLTLTDRAAATPLITAGRTEVAAARRG